MKIPEDLKECKKILTKLTDTKFKRELSVSLRSRLPLIYITTSEERRLDDFFVCYSRVNAYKFYIWDIHRKLLLLNTREYEESSHSSIDNPIAILDHIINIGETLEKRKKMDNSGIVFVLHDFHRFLEEASPGIERRLRVIANFHEEMSVIFTGPDYISTPAVDNLFSILEFPFPNKNEIKDVLYEIAEGISDSIPSIMKDTKKNEEQLIMSVRGLTLHEAESAFSKTIVDKKKWNIEAILQDKKQIIKKNGLLEYCDQKFTADDVGGLKNMMTWLSRRKSCFSEEALEYGLTYPRGLLIIGTSGCVLADTKIKIKKISKEGKCKIYEK